MSRRPLGLAALTVLDCDPIEHITHAEDHGFDTMGLRLLPATPGSTAYPLQESPQSLAEFQRRLADSPVEVLDVEILRLTPEFQVRDALPILETADALGARAVLVAGNDADPGRMADNYARLAAACARHGLVAALEPMPWTQVRTVREAREVGQHADGDAAHGRSILLDAFHVFRSDSTLDEVRAIPAEWVHYAQLCDGPVPGPVTEQELIRQAREERWAPGSSEMDLRSFIGALPEDTPISLEIPNEPQRQALGTGPWLEGLVRATRELLG